jgi:gliding motility-associated-like protein
MYNPIKRIFNNTEPSNPMYKIYNYFKSGLIILALILFISPELMATHIVGGQLNYRCIGNNRYEITMKIYRDCENGLPGAIFDSPASIGIFDGRGNQMMHLGKNGTSGEILIRPIGDDTLSNPIVSCDPNFIGVCVHTTTYIDTLVLPVRAGGYILAYQRCCRNMTIGNIVDPLNTGATYFAVITEGALQVCNQSANFRTWPPVYVCNGKEWSYDHSAIDNDGDSLVYRLNTPYYGATYNTPKPTGSQIGRPPYDGDTITWRAGYSKNNMLGVIDPSKRLVINPNTGIIRGTPEALGQYLVGVCVDEYRNGVLISTYCRDFEVNVVACGDIPEAIFTAPDVQCNNRTVQFTNNSINAVRYEWYFNWPNPTPTQSDMNAVPYTTSHTFADTGSYLVALIAIQDDVCKDTTFKEIIIRDSGLEVDFELEKYLCGDSVTFVLVDITTDSISTPAIWFWEIWYDNFRDSSFLQNPVFSVPLNKKGKIRLTVTSGNGCSFSKEIDFDAVSNQGLIPDFDYVIVKCVDDFRVFVTDNSRDDVGTIISWSYTIESTTIPNATQLGPDTIFGILEGDQNVKITLTIESDSGCIGSITKNFRLLPPDIDFTPDFKVQATECEEKLVIDFLDLSYQGPQYGRPISWDWTIEYEGNTITSTDQNFIGVEFDTTVTVTVTLCIVYEDENGEIICENNCTTRELTLNFIGADFFDLDLTVCARKAVQINPNNPIPGLIWAWEPTNTLVPCCSSPSPWANPLENTIYTVTITDPLINCSVVKDVTVTVVDPDGPAEFTYENECGTLDVDFIATSGGPVVSWDFGDGNTSDEDPATSHTYASAGNYTVTLITGGDCPDTVSQTIRIHFIDIEGLQDTISICEDETVELNPNGNPNLMYVWEPADKIVGSNTVYNPTVRVTEQTTFTVTITDPNIPDCELIRSVTVVLPEPIDLNFGSVLELCKDTTVLFTAFSEAAVKYTWKDADTGEILGEGDSLTIYLTVDRNIKICVEDKYGCTLESQVNVRFFQVVYTLDGDNPMCIGDTVNLCVSSPQENRVVSYMWTPMDRIIGSVINKCVELSPPATTTYTVRITYNDGCVVTGNYTLIVSDFDTPVVCSASEDTILQNQTVDLMVTFDPTYTYQWEPAHLVEDPTAAITKSVPLTENVQFCVTVTNKDGCERECCISETLVLDITCEESVYLPNAFSPNGDGVNDILYVRVFSGFDVVSIDLMIYNRFGQEVFRTKDPIMGWDGTFKGQVQPLGSYGFYLVVNCPDGKEVIKKGNVSIIR